MELKEGMYVRTNDRGIHKISRINNNKTVWKYICDYRPSEDRDGTYTYGIYKSEEIIKASNNIIDLIEVGDYVNGFIVLDIRTDNENEKYIECGCKDEIAFEYIYDTFYNKDIKSIVTKEQFESMSYKL